MAVKRKDPKGHVLRDGETYRNSDGRYMYRYYSADGKRHAIYATDLNVLRAKKEKIQTDMIRGIRIGEDQITLNEMYQIWKRDKRNLKQTTRGNYMYMYEHFIEPEFGKRKIGSIVKSDIRKLYNDMLDTKKMKVTTLDTIHTVLHQVFDVAVDDNRILNNPTNGVMTECKRAHNIDVPKRHALTILQQTAFIEYISTTEKYQHWLPLFTFFLGTGCRVSEVVGLRWQDIDMDQRYIEINHNMVYYQRDNNKCYFSITTPKTEAGKRIIPMLREVREALNNERKYQFKQGIRCNATIDGYTDFIFLNRYGMPHNPQTINRTIKRITLNYNEQEMELAEKEKREPILLPNFSCHNLRHTFCTRYCENETNLKVIQEIMGHKDITTTMNIYAEATSEAKVKSFGNLEGKIKIS